MSYFYIQTEPQLWTVGYERADGTWVPDTDYSDREEAAKRVAYLNGDGDAEQRTGVPEGWTMVFQDSRDFCRVASVMIGATYTSAKDSVERINRQSLWSHYWSFYGKVFASAPEAKGTAPQPAEAKEQALSDAPCDRCGYNGPGYYQPDTHPCAAPEAQEQTHSDTPWRDAVLNECMLIEGAYQPDNPTETLRLLLDWHSRVGVVQPAEVGADERTGFENFMSQRGLAASYQGDGWYRESSTNLAWQAWQARAKLTEAAAPEMLTDKQIDYILYDGLCTPTGGIYPAGVRHFARAVEAATVKALNAAGGQEELEALRRDAERYRYLRDDGDGFDISVREEGDEGEVWLAGYPPDELDAAIDAAIAATQPAQENE